MLQFFEWLVYMVLTILEWLLDLPEKIFLKLLEMILNGAAFVFESIPVPDFIHVIPSIFSAIPPELGFYVNAFNVPEGMAMMVTALVARFLLRRIPVIG